MILRRLLENNQERPQPESSREARTIGELLREMFADHTWQREQAAAIPGRQAEDGAMRLLQGNLSSTQRKQYEDFGHFDVVGGTSGKCYRIHRGYSMNIDELRKDGSIACRWCFSPRGALPAGDVMLAQKLALELYECEALLVANRVARGRPLRATRW